MAFWGVEVKPGKPFTHSCEKARGRLRISKATLGIGEATKKSLVQCNVGNRSPVFLCTLLPDNTESCPLDLEFEEADDVVFSVIGPRSVHLTGYYVHRSQQANAQSDTESYGVDIENSQTDGSSYNSDDDNYEDSFIDDGELQVSPSSPVLSDEVMDEAVLEDRQGNCKQRKKKYQVVESDSETNSHESEDEDGFLLSVFKSKRVMKTALSDDGEKNAQATVQTGNKTEDIGICGSKSQQKVDHLDVSGEPEREAKLPLQNKGTKVKDKKSKRLKEAETQKEIIVSNEKSLTDDKVHGNKTDVTIINQNLHTNNRKNQMQSLDVVKPKKKRKESYKEETACEFGASTDPEMSANCSAHTPILGPENGKKSKKRKKELQSEETLAEDIDGKCHNIPKDDKFKQGSLNADSMTNPLPAANEEYQEQKIDKKTKKINNKKKNTKVEGDLNGSMANKTDHKEKTYTKYGDQIANTMPNQKRTLSNGLIVENVSNGPADGKVAAPGKKVKIYYTAMLKESGRIFDSNVGKTASRFLLGAKEVIEGWNIGIDGMHVGDKRRLIIPPSMGYGKHGAGENVPPNSWLVYEVELVNVRG